MEKNAFYIYEDKTTCSGCGACLAVCPQKAIRMKCDEEGFLYPEIDFKKCVRCQKCKKVCEWQGESKVKFREGKQAIICQNKNESIVRKSRSGGFFMAVANEIIKKQGIVFGCGLDKRFKASHSVSSTFAECIVFQGSKYVQSELKNVFFEVRSALDNGKWVCFSGTPCQVAGLLGFLKNVACDQTKLITCDIVCHGVGSPLVWNSCVEYAEQRLKENLLEVDFRDKRFGWAQHIESFSGKKRTLFSNYYTLLFYFSYILRPSCHNCIYAKAQRVGDFTLADAWKCERVLPKEEVQKGNSLVMINSLKGKELYEELKDNLKITNVSLQEYMQPNLRCPTEKNENRNRFWDDYRTKSFDYVLRKYAKKDLYHHIKKIRKWKTRNVLF